MSSITRFTLALHFFAQILHIKDLTAFRTLQFISTHTSSRQRVSEQQMVEFMTLIFPTIIYNMNICQDRAVIIRGVVYISIYSASCSHIYISGN